MLIVILLTFFCIINLHSFVCLNDIECIFNPGLEKATLKVNMIEGSTHFLLSKANIALLLAEYEKASNSQVEFDFVASYTYCDNAIKDLKAALDDYESAKAIGIKLGYDPGQVLLLKSALYRYPKNPYPYNMDVYNKVMIYLQAGDILGIYTKNIDNLKTILGILETIKISLQNNVKPIGEDYWRLLQTESDATLFGNMATVLASPILKERCAPPPR
ncbi:MAG: hypothetical protein QG657_5863 [Acidobacteriota bacterium]|nr:hypothetical protein [Acidobacteriota bacterium]